MSDFTEHHEAHGATVSLSVRKIEQIASRLCDVQHRESVAYCLTHGNVVTGRSSMCGHVRILVEQILQVVLETERARMDATMDSAPVTGSRWAS